MNGPDSIFAAELRSLSLRFGLSEVHRCISACYDKLTPASDYNGVNCYPYLKEKMYIVEIMVRTNGQDAVAMPTAEGVKLMQAIARSNQDLGPQFLTVKDLKELLNNFPEDTRIAVPHHSDFAPVTLKNMSLIDGVLNSTIGYVMRSHPTMSRYSKGQETKFLAIEPFTG